jgi:hypothetical protein
VPPQAIPAGVLVTVPEPPPWRETASGNVGTPGAVTVTLVAQVTFSGPLVTRTAGAKLPAAEYTWVGFDTALAPPSPKVHAYV